MNATKTGWAANIVGVLLLWAAARGIEVTPAVREMLVLGLSSGGLAINQFLIHLAQRQPSPEPQAASIAPNASGFVLSWFACVLLGLSIVAIGFMSGCASIGQNVDQSKLITQVAVMKVIESDPIHKTERAARIEQLATDAKTFLDSDAVTVFVLADAINARLAALDLQASDRVLATALVQSITADLQQRVGAGLLSPDQKLTVSQVLGWISDAAGYY